MWECRTLYQTSDTNEENNMKKVIGTAIALCILIEAAAVCLFFYFSRGCPGSQAAEVTLMTAQSVLTGLVTFTGLLFTVMAQEAQQKKRYLEEMCPCFAVVCNNVSAKKDASVIGKGKYILASADGEEVRDADVQIINTKDGAALNVSIRRGDNAGFYLGYIGAGEKKAYLVLNAEMPGDFYISFEDVCGNKYEQRIMYEYRKTECCFHSGRVRRIEIYEKGH